MESRIEELIMEYMNLESFQWNIKKWYLTISNQLMIESESQMESQDRFMGMDEIFKSFVMDNVLKYAATMMPSTQDEEGTGLDAMDPSQDNEDKESDAEESFHRKPKKKNSYKSMKLSKSKSKKSSKNNNGWKTSNEESTTRKEKTKLKRLNINDDDDIAGGSDSDTPAVEDENSVTASVSDKEEADSGDEMMDTRNIISTTGRSSRKTSTKPKVKALTYAETVAEMQQKIVSEELQAVVSAERELTEAEVHRKELIEIDEDEKEEMVEKLKSLGRHLCMYLCMYVSVVGYMYVCMYVL
jgi:hypothetical protein